MGCTIGKKLIKEHYNGSEFKLNKDVTLDDVIKNIKQPKRKVLSRTTRTKRYK